MSKAIEKSASGPETGDGDQAQGRRLPISGRGVASGRRDEKPMVPAIVPKPVPECSFLCKHHSEFELRGTSRCCNLLG